MDFRPNNYTYPFSSCGGLDLPVRSEELEKALSERKEVNGSLQLSKKALAKCSTKRKDG